MFGAFLQRLHVYLRICGSNQSIKEVQSIQASSLVTGKIKSASSAGDWLPYTAPCDNNYPRVMTSDKQWLRQTIRKKTLLQIASLKGQKHRRTPRRRIRKLNDWISIVSRIHSISLCDKHDIVRNHNNFYLPLCSTPHFSQFLQP